MRAWAAVLGDVVSLLRCPHCGADLALAGATLGAGGEPTFAGATLGCAAGHSFDVARQGYASLLPGDARADTADDAQMVAARAAFLAAGHYAPAAEALAQACASELRCGPEGAVVDLGAGTGYHLARVLDRLPGRTGLALDLSKHALRRAARAHPRIGAAACDAWLALPVRTGVAAAVMGVFAPRNGAEMSRILAREGTLLLLTPTPRHLAELRPELGLLSVDERKSERLEEQLGEHFRETGRSEHDTALALTHADVERAVAMGPSAHHTDPGLTRRRIATLPEPLPVTASFVLSVFRRRPNVPHPRL